jgi:hypothetical protein
MMWRFGAAFLAIWLPLWASADEPFVGEPRQGVVPLSVQFRDLSTGPAQAWLWYFGDERPAAGTWMGMTLRYRSLGFRSGFACTVLADGAVLFTGGDRGTSLYGQLMDQVWRLDKGKRDWRRLPSATWAARAGHACVTIADGTVFVLGGTVALAWLPANDVWQSGDGGESWSQVITEAPWSARTAHSCVALADGSLLVAGGNGLDGPLHDVWLGTDRGREWTRVCENAPWPARFGHSCVVLPDGGIVLAGGRNRKEQPEGGVWFNDVWRSDDCGATWRRLGGEAPWSARSGHVCVALPNGSLVLVGGMGVGESDAWYSADGGKAWVPSRHSVPWKQTGRCAGVLDHDGDVLMFCAEFGPLAVWRLSTAGSTRQHPAHVYREPGIHDVVLQTHAPNGARRAARPGYIVATARLAGSAETASGRPEKGSTRPVGPEHASTTPGANTQMGRSASRGDGIPVANSPHFAASTPTEDDREPVTGIRRWAWWASPAAEGSAGKHASGRGLPGAPRRALPVFVLGLSFVLFLIGNERRDGDPLRGSLFLANVAVLLLLLLLEASWLLARGKQGFWFCLPSRVGWTWAVPGFLLFTLVVYNQLVCSLRAVRDLRGLAKDSRAQRQRH